MNQIGPWSVNQTHCCDCLTGMQSIPSNIFDMAVTSPPYWGQRDSVGLGLEPDPRDYIRNLVTILVEVMRCLKPSATLWLNLGDAFNTPINWRTDDYCYSSLGKNGDGLPATNSAYTKRRGSRRACIHKDVPWLKYGNLLAIPYRVVTGLCDSGILFRGEVIWENRGHYRKVVVVVRTVSMKASISLLKVNNIYFKLNHQLDQFGN